MQKVCAQCGTKKNISNFYVNKKMEDGRFNECKNCVIKRVKKNSHSIVRNCAVCGKQFGTCTSEIRRGENRGKFCSSECYDKFPHKRGTQHHSWKGGKIYSPNGYVYIYRPSHARANKKGYVMEHIYAISEHLKQDILPSMAVHHIDGDKQNNNINNLMLFPTRGAHTKYHWELKRLSKLK